MYYLKREILSTGKCKYFVYSGSSLKCFGQFTGTDYASDHQEIVEWYIMAVFCFGQRVLWRYVNV